MDRVIEIKRQHGVATIKMMSGDTLRVPSPLYLERRLRVNEPLDADAYRLFMAQRGYPHALEASMKFLALRERSEQEVRARLRRSCYDESTIARVLDTLNLHELVSDTRFAEQWVASRARKYGRGRIAQELRFKGISGQDAQSALAALPEEDEYQTALEQARRLARKFRNEPQKITQALVRRGYGWPLARKAAAEAGQKESESGL